MRGNVSGGVEHSFPEPSTMPGFPLRDGDSQSHLSDFLVFFFFEGEELWVRWVAGWGGGCWG